MTIFSLISVVEMLEFCLEITEQIIMMTSRNVELPIFSLWWALVCTTRPTAGYATASGVVSDRCPEFPGNRSSLSADGAGLNTLGRNYAQKYCDFSTGSQKKNLSRNRFRIGECANILYNCMWRLSGQLYIAEWMPNDLRCPSLNFIFFPIKRCAFERWQLEEEQIKQNVGSIFFFYLGHLSVLKKFHDLPECSGVTWGGWAGWALRLPRSLLGGNVYKWREIREGKKEEGKRERKERGRRKEKGERKGGKKEGRKKGGKKATKKEGNTKREGES